MMTERFGDKVKFRRYGVRRPFFARFGARIFDDAAHALEERSAFAQFGL
jgi:serine protease SohB